MRGLPQASERDGCFGAMWPRNPSSPMSLPFTVRFLRLHVRAQPEPQVVSAHVHDDLELLLPWSGTWRGAVNGEALSVPAGGALLVAPGDRHEDRSHQPVSLFGISLELLPGPRPACSAPLLAVDATVGQRRLASAPILHAVAERLVKLTRVGGRWAVLRQDALAHELLVELLAALPFSALAPNVAERVAAAGFGAELAAVLAARPMGLSVPALAKAMGLGERALQLQCQRVLGLTPFALITRHRLVFAQDLLATGASVQAVAEQVGYANPFHFSTAFKRAFGHPPSQVVRESEGHRLPRVWSSDRVDALSHE